MAKKAWIRRQVIDLNKQARELRNEGCGEEAIGIYNRALRLDRHNLITLTNLGNLHMERGEHPQAFHYLWQAYDLDRDGVQGKRDTYVLVSLGSLHAVRGEYRYAHQKFMEALKIDPEDKMTRIRLANLFTQFGLTRLAREQFEIAGEAQSVTDSGKPVSQMDMNLSQGLLQTLFPAEEGSFDCSERIARRQNFELALAK